MKKDSGVIGCGLLPGNFCPSVGGVAANALWVGGRLGSGVWAVVEGSRKGGELRVVSALICMGVVLEKREGLQAVGSRRRDRELVRLIGRHGAMTIEHVMRAMGAGKSATYRRFARCEKAGLVKRCLFVGADAAVLHATKAGLLYARLGLPVAAISPATVEHMLRCTSVAISLGERVGHDRVLTEREIVLEEAIEDRQIASVPIGSFRGRPRMHRADLAVLVDEGTIAVEVELTPKSPARLRGIVSAWARAAYTGVVAEVHYLCEPEKTFRAVERAVISVGAQGCIAVLDEVPR